ncbi:MAG: polysaccharide deacetylase family protein [Bacteroidota bacterium]
MLNFRNTNIFFLLLLLFTVGVHFQKGVPFLVYPILLVAYSLVVFYGCYFIDSNFFLPVVCAANTTHKKIALSFDDGPAELYTPETLRILQDQDIKAAFFCIGNRIPGNEQILTRIHSEGHLVGNHSHSHHFWFDLFSAEKMQQDLARMDKATMSAIQVKPLLFRPPYGVTNPNLARAIKRGGYTPVGWSVRSLDTVKQDPGKLLSKMQAQLKPGAIYLFHDTSKAMLEILPQFISAVKAAGYEIVRLDKMLNLKPYA